MLITLGEESFDIYSLSNYADLDRAAVYSIWTYNPRTQLYPLLYVGESGEVGTRVGPGHHKYSAWERHAINGLYIGVKYMPTRIYPVEQRLAEEARLIRLYGPICNG